MTAVGSAASAVAGGSPAYLFNAGDVDDDTELFLNLTIRSYGYPRGTVETIVPQLSVVEADLPVVLFLARETGCSPQRIVKLRSAGLTWSDIFDRLEMPADILFVGLSRNPGPPYDKAWGFWRKHGRRAAIADDDVVELARLQIAHRLLGLPTFDLARFCRGGKPVAGVVADRKGRAWRGEFSEYADSER
jgi:hypothetical protein